MRFKGGIEDAFTIATILLLLGILAVFGYFFADKILTQIEGVGMPGLPANLHQQATGTFQFLDGVIAFVLVLLIGGSFALAFFSRGHPYLAVITCFIQIFFLIGSYFVKVFWFSFNEANAELGAISVNQFPITNIIFTYLPFISFIILMGVIVLFFTKSKDEYAVGV